MFRWRFPTITFSSFKRSSFLLVFLSAFNASVACAADHHNDPHYVPSGFFDIHVCNWPNRPLFFMALFSTVQFADVESVQMRDPRGHVLGELDLQRFETFKTKEGQEKRVFISHYDVPKNARSGWYRATIRMRDGVTYQAKDLVKIKRMALPSGFIPGDQAKLSEAPSELRWHAIPGARFYQVTIRDVWQEGKRIYKSKLLTEPRVTLPPDLLQKGGSYTWKVHARDVNEDKKLGDFNHGTLGPNIAFSIDAG